MNGGDDKTGSRGKQTLSEPVQLVCSVLLPLTAIYSAYIGVDAILNRQFVFESADHSIRLFGSDMWIGVAGVFLMSISLVLITILVVGYPKSLQFKRLRMAAQVVLILACAVLAFASIVG